ncbi:MAG TPA: Ig-like domain-containing protein [Allosphingosinicella sp.]|nr:Ig-like domain-containing protein [Allosphingosinicella sp.]
MHASETTSYKYDALGRLVEQSSTGTINNGQKTQLCYDPAGNRSTYTVAGVGAPAPPPPACPAPPPPGPPPPGSPPPPPPPGSNQPPTTVADSATVAKCGTVTRNVTANDTDPEGNYPLVLLSVTSTKGTAVVDGTTSVTFTNNGQTGLASLTYTVRDSLGATSQGTFDVTISTTGQCE